MSGFSPDNVLELRGVGLLRGRWLLQEVDWTVRRGEHWAIVGPNGCGKTTLLRIVSSYLFPSAGELCVAGHEFGASDLRDLKKRIGWVSAAVTQHIGPQATPLDLVVWGEDGRFVSFDPPGPAQTAKALALLADLGIAAIARAPFEVLSTGERQRTLIARALMCNPVLLILDEPFTGLDFRAREETMAALEALVAARTDLTVLLVTHHVEEIFPAIRHGLLMTGGRVLAAGPLTEILTGPRLSEAFAVPMSVFHDDGRYHTQVKWNRPRPSAAGGVDAAGNRPADGRAAGSASAGGG
ncbi:MAG: ABC transporter ATP-binding protein [Planctomycetota bacterium]